MLEKKESMKEILQLVKEELEQTFNHPKGG